MKTKLFQLLFLVTLFCITTPVVNASEVYFTNKNNVRMSKVEYNNIVKIHTESFVNEITQEMFEENKEYYSNPNIIINVSDSDNTYRPRSSYIETNAKSIRVTMTTAGTSSNLIVVTATWKSMPNVRSYDVLGVRLVNTSFTNSVKTIAFFDDKAYNPSATKQFSNGFGASIKLIPSISSIKIQQTFKAEAGGTVYASYQHAVKNISLADSQNFKIDSNGLGSVFKFNNNDLFDKMSGVRIGT